MDRREFEAALDAVMMYFAIMSWAEPHRHEPGKLFRQARRMVPIDLLDEMERRGWIRFAMKSNRVHVTDAGYERGRKLAGLE